jgi:quercetin dioxygenase-like cupin family protein
LKTSGADTDGAFMVVEYDLTSDIPPHVHIGQHESFYVLDGALTVEVGDEEFTAGVGDYVFLPGGVPHALTATSRTPPTLLTIATPNASSGGVWPVPSGTGGTSLRAGPAWGGSARSAWPGHGVGWAGGAGLDAAGGPYLGPRAHKRS